jgi:ketosteroid isomerase-like protein
MNANRWLTLLALGAAACADPQGLHDSQVADGVPAGGASLAEVHANAERDILRAADLAHSAAAQTGAAGFLSALTEDVLFLLPISPLAQGKAAAGALLAAPPFPFGPNMKMSWSPALVDVSVDAQVGYSFGNVQIADAAVAPDVLVAQYIAFWRRQSDGNWKVEAWSLSGAGAEPGEVPPFPSFGHPLDNGLGNFTPVDQTAVEQELLSVDAAFAAASVDLGAAEAFRMFADPHAIVLGGGDPDFIVGRKEIFLSRSGAPPENVLDWTPHFAGVGPLGDLGYTVGNFVFTSPARTGFGKYLTIWQQSPNGTWKFVQDGGSSTPPPAP